MSNPWRRMPFAEAVEINPRRTIDRRSLAPFVDMAALPRETRDVSKTRIKLVGAGGSRFMNGDTLFARITPCTENGKTGLVDCLAAGEVATGSTEFIVLGPRHDLTLSRFIYYLAKDPKFRSFAISRMRGTSGRQRVPASVFDDFEVGVPPVPEQRKIASILSSVDDAIKKTQAVIDQVQVVKRSLMQELLTRGMPGRHTRFKQTEIGEIPEEWEAVTIGELGHDSRSTVRTGPFGSTMKTKDFRSHGVPVITIQSLGEGELYAPGLFFTSKEKADELSEYSVAEGDLVFSRVADIGRSLAVDARQSGWLISPNVMRIRPDRRKVYSRFMMYAVTLAEAVLRQIVSVSGNAGRPVVSSSILRRLRVPVPAIDEQGEIVCAGQALERRIRTEMESLTLLQEIKSALMSVLLTGEVRVIPDTEAA